MFTLDKAPVSSERIFLPAYDPKVGEQQECKARGASCTKQWKHKHLTKMETCIYVFYMHIYIHISVCIYIQLYTYKEHVKSKPMHQTYQCNRVSGTNPPISKRSALLMDPKNQDWITLLWQLWMHKSGILHPAAKSRHAWTYSDFSRMILSQSWVAKVLQESRPLLLRAHQLLSALCLESERKQLQQGNEGKIKRHAPVCP